MYAGFATALKLNHAVPHSNQHSLAAGFSGRQRSNDASQCVACERPLLLVASLQHLAPQPMVLLQGYFSTADCVTQ